MNQKDPRLLIDELQAGVERSENGVVYSVLQGDNPDEYSNTSALVVFNPFAGAATPNLLVRAEFIREVAKTEGVRDPSDGKLKPVVMLASPGLIGSRPLLSEDERVEVRNGELGLVARELLRAVGQREFGEVALLGFSQGADMALAGARSAYSAGLDVRALGIGDPAGVEERTSRELGRDFLKAGTADLKSAIAATGLEAQKRALGLGVVDFARFGMSAMLPMNLDLYKGLTHDVFEARMREVLDDGGLNKLVAAYGSDSAITKPERIEPAIEQLNDESGQDAIISIRVNQAKHTWGDQLTLLAKLYMRAAS